MKKNKLYTVNPWNQGLFNTYGIGGDFKKAFGKEGLSDTLTGIGSAVAGQVGYGLISDGYESGVGNTLHGLSSAFGAVPVVGKYLGPAAEIAGAVWNRIGGIKTNQAALKNAKEGIAYYNTQGRAEASNFDEVKPLVSYGFTNPFKGSLFKSAAGQNNALRNAFNEAQGFAVRGKENEIKILQDDQLNNLLAKNFSDGGPLGFGEGALGIMKDNRYFDSIDKRTEAIAKNNMGYSGLSTYAFGGELGTNGTDFTSGLLYVDEGGSHESNPLEGVPMGMDAEGTPNLVEEGETVYNDYVFSDRMMVPKTLYHELGLGGAIKKGISFADASKKLAKESEQRPNDPISIDGLEASLSRLAAVQEAERMKKQMEEYATGLQEYACGGKMKKHGLGGNLFAGGGNKAALEWLEKNYPEHGNKDEVARWMTVYSKKHVPAYRAGKAGVSQKIDDSEWRDIYAMVRGLDSWSPTLSSLYEAANIKWNLRTEKGRREHFDMLVKNGMDRKVAFGFAYPQGTSKSTKEYNTNREKAYNELIRNYKGSKVNTPGVTATNNSNNYKQTKAEKENVPPTKAETAAKKAAEEAGAQTAAGTGTSVGLGYTAPTGTYAPAESVYSAAAPRINPYAYSDSWEGFNYFNPETSSYDQGYLNFVNGINQDWVNRIMNGQYGSMDRYLAKNTGTMPSIEEVQSLATDQKYSDMHKAMAAAYQDYLKGIDPVTGERTAPAAASESVSPIRPEAQGQTDYLAKYAQDWTPKPAETQSAETTTPAEIGGQGTKNKPKTYDTWMRYAPVAGAGIMTLTDALGLTNKPDYTYADKLEAMAQRAGYATNIKYEPIGDYLRYEPFDRLFYSNQLQANARATDRALSNTSSPSKAAGLIANGYNTTNALGNLYRQAEEYNLAQREKVADFNRRTNMFNSQMGLEADMANARYRQAASQMGLSGLAQAAALRDTIDQRIGAAKAMNLNNLLTSLGNIGRENYIMNQINHDDAYQYGVDSRGRSPWKGEKPKKYGGKMNKRKK